MTPSRTSASPVDHQRLERIEHNSWLYQHEQDEIRDLLDDPSADLDWQVVIFEERIRERRASWEMSR